MGSRNRWIVAGVTAVLLCGAGALAVHAQRGGADERPEWIAVRPTAFERPPNVRVGDELRFEPNLTIALNALAGMGYEPRFLGADDHGPLLVGRRR